MKINYTDLSLFIEHIVENASKEGFPIADVDELHEYLDEHAGEEINIIERNTQ